MIMLGSVAQIRIRVVASSVELLRQAAHAGKSYVGFTGMSNSILVWVTDPFYLDR